MISRALIPNVDYFEKFRFGVGDQIEVFKANLIIPQIDSNITQSGTFKLIKTCPCCGSELQIVETESSRHTTLNRVIAAVGIPTVGRSAGREISEHFNGDEDQEMNFIHSYGYKPAPNFKRCTCEDAKRIRYYGVELEIDDGGYSDDNAEDILYEANGKSDDEELLYIKTDGSLKEGMELVSHPCSILYHRTIFSWERIAQRARSLGYSSHNAGTCGLHFHISRDKLVETIEAQEETIGRLMYGISPDELELLYELGYDDMDIEIMCYDPEYLQACLEEAKEFFEYCESSRCTG